MLRANYYIEYADGWKIRLNGKQFGPCRDQTHAIDVAVRAASKARDKGCDAQVLVQDLSNQFQLEWPAPSGNSTGFRRSA